MRTLYTLLTLAAVAGLYALMLQGWRGRQRRQAHLPAPPAPPAVRGEPLLAALPGVFVGTTFASDWLDRVAVHGLSHRATGWLLVARDGVHLERDGRPDLYLPYASIDRVATGDALAGKVVGQDGLVLFDWHLGTHLVTSGFRADGHENHARVVEAVTAQLSNRARA